MLIKRRPVPTCSSFQPWPQPSPTKSSSIASTFSVCHANCANTHTNKHRSAVLCKSRTHQQAPPIHTHTHTGVPLVCASVKKRAQHRVQADYLAAGAEPPLRGQKVITSRPPLACMSAATSPALSAGWQILTARQLSQVYSYGAHNASARTGACAGSSVLRQ